MSLGLFTLLLLLGAIFAGTIGTLTGMGGGVVLIPMLVLGFGVDLRYAAGTSLIAVIATSCGAALKRRENLSNLHVGVFLEIAAVAGAVGGALVARDISKSVLEGLLGITLLGSALLAMRAPDVAAASPVGSDRLELAGAFDDQGQHVAYAPRHIPAGLALMGVAGLMSGLLGIGSGALKTLAMDLVMRLPLKVSTATSNFMIGITAGASAAIYFRQGFIDPVLIGPVTLGTLGGAVLGSWMLPHLRTRWLRPFFALVVGFLGVEILWEAWRAWHG
ncbi:MAG: sulfite exporter TauE/SafE family protein [Metallibacterium scheffleri]|jgi:hypothetical protein|uniref:sulfite exporter TauE/SafE family protein n=1 Tax=Metallibacterium scheffleri TaxID=993689 RepID=UPI0026EC6601|nr:sulfite exporter TauE/SafE family protein [Metallibacterium scheffleri]MCK9366369.1 sulfite exporter TauE/SafE family protein [Metallibacterium scheffleri]